MAETLSAVGEDYQNSIQVMLDNLSLAKTRMNEKEAANLDVLVHSFSDQIERMNRYFALLQNRNHINPILRQSSIAQTIQRAITDAIVPSNVKVDTVNRTKNALMLDAPMITRALTEVIDAAVREMPTGGLLSIRDQVNANVVEVVVENTGVSQWKGNVTTIFDPESQVDTSTGLGLVIAKRFIEAHKGQLQVTNEEGKGSVFTIKLPANPA
jgi:signal transduction histidine kinase